MRCRGLSELPPPPPGKTGWPWTEEGSAWPDSAREAESYPRVTVITPSYNQAAFIEETMRSVILQGYPNLEYFVLDGGSTDNTVEVMKKYSPWITAWCSGPDAGQSAAINRGLRMGTGTFATWINSDDMLCKDAFYNHFTGATRSDRVVYIGDCVNIDEQNRILFSHRGTVRSLEELLRIPTVWRSGGSIDQPAVLFPLELALRAGGLNEKNHYAMDYELWGKFLLHEAEFSYTGIRFGCFRWHAAQKTQDRIQQTEDLLDSAAALAREATSLAPATRRAILEDLEKYRRQYPDALWKDSGRLARTGLPRPIVTMLRDSRDQLARCSKTLWHLVANRRRPGAQPTTNSR